MCFSFTRRVCATSLIIHETNFVGDTEKPHTVTFSPSSKNRCYSRGCRAKEGLLQTSPLPGNLRCSRMHDTATLAPREVEVLE